jgi:hypothetical protein
MASARLPSPPCWKNEDCGECYNSHFISGSRLIHSLSQPPAARKRHLRLWSRRAMPIPPRDRPCKPPAWCRRSGWCRSGEPARIDTRHERDRSRDPPICSLCHWPVRASVDSQFWKGHVYLIGFSQPFLFFDCLIAGGLSPCGPVGLRPPSLFHYGKPSGAESCSAAEQIGAGRIFRTWHSRSSVVSIWLR